MQWGNRSKSKSVGQFDPQRFGEDGVTVFSAADKTRCKILDLSFAMNERVSVYLQYKKSGRMLPMACEEAQRAVQELFSLVRESVVAWMGERLKRIHGLRAQKKQSEELPGLLVEYEADLEVFKGLDLLDLGNDARDEFLIAAKRFMNKYVYQRGISKLEIENKDPIAEYSKGAYGKDYTKEEEDPDASDTTTT